MQGECNGIFVPSIKVHYNGQLDASMQGCIKVSIMPPITVHYNR
jgi:hypothetical protein